MLSNGRCPDDRYGRRVEESVFRIRNADGAGGLRFVPEEIVIITGKYNLPVHVVLYVFVSFVADPS
ncbi:hypothetical protein [Paenarthrobacter sp. 2TAF44]|uniref:hypothetical protein n=1 Tax=Paenarthrobacter sp. 2TAF44 TaxID=3233018 RepID=UPI003F9ACBF6